MTSSTTTFAPARARAYPLTLLADVARFVVRGALGFAIVLAAAVTVPVVAGYRSFPVLSGSMAPTLRVGDLIVESRIRPTDLHVGDIVTFRDPEATSRLLTHRVRTFHVRGGRVDVVTRGDANEDAERWSIPVTGQIGRVEYHIPRLGYVAARASGGYGQLALLVFPALLLAALELRRIWMPRAETG